MNYPYLRAGTSNLLAYSVLKYGKKLRLLLSNFFIYKFLQ